jgi:hypothetical protein
VVSGKGRGMQTPIENVPEEVELVDNAAGQVGVVVVEVLNRGLQLKLEGVLVVVIVGHYPAEDGGQSSEKIERRLLIASRRVSDECGGGMILKGSVQAVDDAHSHGGVEGDAGQALYCLVRGEEGFVCGVLD